MKINLQHLKYNHVEGMKGCKSREGEARTIEDQLIFTRKFYKNLGKYALIHNCPIPVSLFEKWLSETRTSKQKRRKNVFRSSNLKYFLFCS